LEDAAGKAPDNDEVESLTHKRSEQRFYDRIEDNDIRIREYLY